jgi:electron transfer flavoprotein alpha subunit
MVMTHEEMLEEAEKREKENQVLEIAKNIMEEHKEAFQHLAAIERKELAEKDFKDLTRDQKIQLALEEVDWIVIGGQDGEEFYNSIEFIRKVLRSLRDT